MPKDMNDDGGGNGGGMPILTRTMAIGRNSDARETVCSILKQLDEEGSVAAFPAYRIEARLMTAAEVAALEAALEPRFEGGTGWIVTGGSIAISVFDADAT